VLARTIYAGRKMVLFLHNRYRTRGGEERTVDDLLWVVREHLHEPVELLQRDSTELTRAAAAVGLLRGGSRSQEIARAVRNSNARVVHAHNVHPTLGWRALAAARSAGARVVLHLHQYRLVCAVGVCFTRGEECTRCHGRNTLPGVVRNCRGSRAEAVAYGASLAAWQRRLLAHADEVIVPSAFALERLRALGAPLREKRVHVLAPPLRSLARAAASAQERGPKTWTDRATSAPVDGPYALVAARLSAEKGVDVAIDACGLAHIELVVAGDGPEREELRARARGRRVHFVGHVGAEELARLRAGAAIALVPSRSGESFGLSAAEALAAGIPVVASRVGALGEVVEEDALVPPGDARALAAAIARLAGDRAAGERGRDRVRALCAPEVVARGLRAVYAGADGRGVSA
jgi:glycosyltransferase involved in cell wall biosynthesis